MTIKELIEELSQYPQDLRVVISGEDEWTTALDVYPSKIMYQPIDGGSDTQFFESFKPGDKIYQVVLIDWTIKRK